MSDELIELEEEEYTSQLTGAVFRRLLGLIRPHWKWALGWGVGERIQSDLRKMMFNHLQELSLSYYAQNAVGRLIARVTSDTGRVSDLLTWGIVDTTWAVMNIISS